MEQENSKDQSQESEDNKNIISDSPQPKVSFWKKYKGEIGLVIMFIYLFLLGLGTIGEIWEIEWILDLPIFRSVGKWER